jgi:hypothetical protein
MKRKKEKIILLLVMLATGYLLAASVRLCRMCQPGAWEYYNYPEMKQDKQITFARLVRYAMWLEEAPTYSADACINNLRRIDGAKQQWAIENNKRNGDEVTWKDIDFYTTRPEWTGHPWRPRCWAGGVYYSLGRAGEAPKCSIREHTLE